MALHRNVGGIVSLAAGATHHWEYWFDGFGRDVGVAVAAANIQEPQDNVELVTVSQGVVARSNGETDGIHYTVNIRNAGAAAIHYNLSIAEWS
jgi:hypothetical protein